MTKTTKKIKSLNPSIFILLFTNFLFFSLWSIWTIGFLILLQSVVWILRSFVVGFHICWSVLLRNLTLSRGLGILCWRPLSRLWRCSFVIVEFLVSLLLFFCVRPTSLSVPLSRCRIMIIIFLHLIISIAYPWSFVLSSNVLLSFSISGCIAHTWILSISWRIYPFLICILVWGKVGSSWCWVSLLIFYILISLTPRLIVLFSSKIFPIIVSSCLSKAIFYWWTLIIPFSEFSLLSILFGKFRIVVWIISLKVSSISLLFPILVAWTIAFTMIPSLLLFYRILIICIATIVSLPIVSFSSPYSPIHLVSFLWIAIPFSCILIVFGKLLEILICENFPSFTIFILNVISSHLIISIHTIIFIPFVIALIIRSLPIIWSISTLIAISFNSTLRTLYMISILITLYLSPILRTIHFISVILIILSSTFITLGILIVFVFAIDTKILCWYIIRIVSFLILPISIECFIVYYSDIVVTHSEIV